MKNIYTFAMKKKKFKLDVWLWVVVWLCLCKGMDDTNISNDYVNMKLERDQTHDAWGFLWNKENVPWTVIKVFRGSQASLVGVEVGWKLVKLEWEDITTENASVMNLKVAAGSKAMCFTFQPPDLPKKEYFRVGDLLYLKENNDTNIYSITNIYSDSTQIICEIKNLSSTRIEKLLLKSVKKFYHNFGPVNKTMAENKDHVFPKTLQGFAQKKLGKLLDYQFRAGDWVHNVNEDFYEFYKVHAVGKNEIVLDKPPNRYVYLYADFDVDFYEKLGQQGDLIMMTENVNIQTDKGIRMQQVREIYIIDKISPHQTIWAYNIENNNAATVTTRLNYQPKKFINFGPVNKTLANIKNRYLPDEVFNFVQKKMQEMQEKKITPGDIIKYGNTGHFGYVREVQKNGFEIIVGNNGQQHFIFIWHGLLSPVIQFVAKKNVAYQLQTNIRALEITEDLPDENTTELRVLLKKADNIQFQILNFWYDSDGWNYYVHVLNATNPTLKKKMYKIKANTFPDTDTTFSSCYEFSDVFKEKKSENQVEKKTQTNFKDTEPLFKVHRDARAEYDPKILKIFEEQNMIQKFANTNIY